MKKAPTQKSAAEKSKPAAKKTATGKHPGGRPSIYTEALEADICARIATGESLRNICRDDKMPSLQTIFVWMRNKPKFVEQYARAKEASADAMVDDILDIADNQVEQPLIVDGLPVQVDEKLVMVRDMVSVNHAKLRVDARKWVAAKLKPKKYGDKIMSEVSGPDGGPIQSSLDVSALPLDVLKAIMAASDADKSK